MFNFFKKKPKPITKLDKLITDKNQAIIFADLLKQSIKLTREVDGHTILLGLTINDTKVILDEELCVLLLSILKEYCLTKDILQSISLIQKENN